MSDLGDFGLPSYPTFPTSSPSNPTEHEQPLPFSLPSTTSRNNRTTWGMPTAPSQPLAIRGLATTGGAGNPFHSMDYTSPSLSVHGQDATMSSVYPITSSPYSTLEDISNSISHTPPSISSNMNSHCAASGGLSSLMGTGQVLQSSNTHQFTVSGSPLLPADTLDFPRSKSYMSECTPVSELPPQESLINSPDSMVLRVQCLEKLCAKLQKERAEMEEMFGRQRKSFMNQMCQSDAQLSICKKRIDSYTSEVKELSAQVLSKDKQLNDCTIAAHIKEESIREMFDADRVKYEEEIASLTKIVSVQVQDTGQVLQEERDRWQADRARLVAEFEELRREQMATNNPNYQPSSAVALAASPSEHHMRSPSPTSEDETLELSMIKAAEETKKLRSVVLPLEKEISSLKEKLKQAESNVFELLAVAEDKVVSAPAATDLDMTLSFSEQDSSHDFNSSASSDLNELQQQLRLARSACDDLEMHTSQLNLQKHTMQSNIKSLTSQLREAKLQCETEKNQVSDLKKTWEIANEHFIASRDKLKQEVYRLHQKLVQEQPASPLHDLNIGPFPNLPEVSQVDDKERTTSRRHQRSLSTDEATEAMLDTLAVQHNVKSASCSSLYKLSFSSRCEAHGAAEALEEELKKVRGELEQQTIMCSSYAQQLPRVQKQLMRDLSEKEDIIDKLKTDNEKFKAHVMRQRQQHDSLRRLMDDLNDEMKTRIETFQANEIELRNQMKILKDKFTELKLDSQREIAKMSDVRRLHRAREEYDCLKVVQMEDMAKYQAEIADLKQMQLDRNTKLTTITAQLSSSKEQLRHAREMMLTERNNKERISEKLEVAERRIGELFPLEYRLEAEKLAKEEAIASKVVIEKKAREFVTEQKNTIERLNKDKLSKLHVVNQESAGWSHCCFQNATSNAAENQVDELHRQISSLKHNLNYTEETQKDFVELSQSLQMKIAVMEESQEHLESCSTDNT